MPKLILTSQEVLWSSVNGQPYPDIVDALQKSCDAGNSVFLVSSREEPLWLKEYYPFVTFQKAKWPNTKPSGKIVRAIIDVNKDTQQLKISDIFVLGATETDFFMATQSHCLLLCSGWADTVHEKVIKYGVKLKSPKAIPLVIKLLDDQKPWYFIRTGECFEIYALTNAGTYGEDNNKMITLIAKLKGCLKGGDKRHSAVFKLHLLSSLLVSPAFREADIWTYYPSADSSNNEEEIIAGYSELARVTFGKRTKGPVFIRHRHCQKRHLGSDDRIDPKSQLESIHLNPKYKGDLKGKTVVIIDDYTTYGVSLGVSVALLKAAGAKKCIFVALGKFGDCGKLYDIDFDGTDLYKPLNGGYNVHEIRDMIGSIDPQAQLEFLDKFLTFI